MNAANFRAGDRVRLVSMTDDPDPIPAGTTGTVAGVYPQNGWTQVDVDWDTGRSLMLSIPPDVVVLIDGMPTTQALGD
ncbi:DUF4314 domain-containing protein [Roseiconus nitratireducens]|uniref:DUF4314 domain-containing protein n=1 Tax=Roseiconus nitratireducens TaxID=2605748 RepID=A0A5M6D1W8_9BACT|nr:DUF4314 domain-containing protein [Roseiconus nitratireducens]KAA5541501.1 DUF4314 domain-containing protein [Roseiconus nitratireducens]